MNYISENAIIGEYFSHGENLIIEDNVKIGNNVSIGHNVVIKKDTKIGDNCIVSDNVVLGKEPFKASNSAVTENNDLAPLEIKNLVTIGALTVIYRGAVLSNEVFIADLASVREDVKVGRKTIIGKGVTIENKTNIGNFVKIETEAYITALSEIEDYCFIAPEVTFTNDNFLGRTENRKKYFKGPLLKKGCRVGANSTLLPGIIIEEDSLIAAGSVVTKNTEKGKIYLGAPAKIFGEVPKEQLLENQIYYNKEI
ncbi:MAG: DapH/DapD/GlmU-related protein [Thermotogota bacterium]